MRPPDILLTTPEQLALLLSHRGLRATSSPTSTPSSSTSCTRLPPSKRGDLLALDLARLRTLAPRADRRSACRQRWRGPSELRAYLVPQREPDTLHRPRRSRASPTAAPSRTSRSWRSRSRCPGRATRRATPIHEIYAAIARASPERSCSSTRACRRSCCSRSCGGSTRPGPADRAASRLARRRAAPQGRGGDGGGPAARRRLHLHARPRHRLGRRRSRHQRRRAEGRQPPHPAHRPRQPPPRRALAGAPRAGQPLRGARVPRRARCGRGRRAGRDAVAHAARSTCWPSTCSAWRAPARSSPMRCSTRSARHRPTRRSTRDDASTASSISSRPAATRCKILRPLRQAESRRTTGGSALAHPRFAQQYRLNAGTIVEAPLIKVRLVGRAARPRRGRRARHDGRPRARRGRRVFHRAACARRYVRVRGRGAALRRACARRRRSSPRASARDAESPELRRRQVPALDASGRAACARCWRTRQAGASLPAPVADWLELQQTRSLIPGRGRGADRDLPRAEAATISWPTRSRAGSPTRRSACC